MNVVWCHFELATVHFLLSSLEPIANSEASFSMAKMAGENYGAKNLNAKKRGGAISTENSY